MRTNDHEQRNWMMSMTALAMILRAGVLAVLADKKVIK